MVRLVTASGEGSASCSTRGWTPCGDGKMVESIATAVEQSTTTGGNGAMKRVISALLSVGMM